MARPSYIGVTWSEHLYALAATPGSGRHGELLAVCTQHAGRHARHGRPPDDMWCQMLPPHRPRSRLDRALARLRHDDEVA